MKYRTATVYPPESGKRKMVLTIPGRNVRETIVMASENLSDFRRWCAANGYKLDESRLVKPEKPKYEPEDEYNWEW